ncbi:hypothetical protein CANARDRAFT_29360 [[Candida] arabinofermentans NRRL YB-2248]|uniref:Uncharacterized protein n=1 Tax=[Candida] arabinofermentans NRRL YB-2248 TaxID=983967 RepID=A0A1E4SXK2_9ASCO|nr:hypothetical protein CANARDRAFT_29360 [[Candida] arabinofermentans NRRL YB-2248]
MSETEDTPMQQEHQNEEQYEEAPSEQFEEPQSHKESSEEHQNGDLYPRESSSSEDTNDRDTNGGQGDDPDDEYDKSITEDVIYEITETPQFSETRALIIANLSGPFDNKDFQDLLNEQAAKTDSTIERAWLNARRTHCIVIVSDIAGASSIQKNLNGRVFPYTQGDDNVEDKEQEQEEEEEPKLDENGEPIKRHKLFIDFIPVKATQHWIDQENKGPKDAVWKISYVKLPSKQQQGSDFLVATHKMLNYPNKTFGYKSSGQRSSRGRGRGSNYRSHRGRSNYNSSSRPYPAGSYDPYYANARYGNYYPDHQQQYGGYNSYTQPQDDRYYGRYGSAPPSQSRGNYYGGPGGYKGNRGGYRGGRGGGYDNGYRSNRYEPYHARSQQQPPQQQYPQPPAGASADNEYARDRSPVRNNDSYASRSPTRSPPRQTRSPEWST